MAYLDQINNFAKCTVSTGYDASATTVVLSGSEGGKLPSFPGNGYNVVWWNSTDYADPCDDPNREIVRVTARTGDTLTVTRSQESTAAATHNTANKTYKMALCVTKKLVTDIESKIVGLNATAFRARKNGDQTIATATWTKVLFATEEFDTAPMWDSSNSRLTPSSSGPYAGCYLLSWTVYIASPSSDMQLKMAIYKNGVLLEQVYHYATGTNAMIVRMTSLVQNAGGDYFEAFIYQSTGGDVVLTAGSDVSHIEGFLVYPGA